MAARAVRPALMLAVTLGAAVPRGAGAEIQLRNDQEVERFFGTVCGWCHEDGGRRRGKGPALMGTTRSDDYLVNRIATGKPGKMPAFGQTLTLEQVEAIVHYIRHLKPKGAVAP